MNEESLVLEKEAFEKEKEKFDKVKQDFRKEQELLIQEKGGRESRAKNRQSRLYWGFRAFVGAMLIFLVCTIFFEKPYDLPWVGRFPLFLIIVLLIISTLTIFDFSSILFDPEEYTSNTFTRAIVKKMRYRGVLFNNIAIILFLLTLVIIGLCFYLFFNPNVAETNSKNDWVDHLTVRLGSSILLVFLVQILFKVFKYLLRVAAFYNGRADAIEINLIDPKSDLVKMTDLFTPEKYDISELEKLSIFDNVSDVLKAKLGK